MVPQNFPLLAFRQVQVSLVFSGTTGTTGAMKPEDVVEVDISGGGVLRNFVRAED